MNTRHHGQTHRTHELSLTHTDSDNSLDLIIDREGIEETTSTDLSPNTTPIERLTQHYNYQMKPYTTQRQQSRRNKRAKVVSFSPISQIEIYDIIIDDDLSSKAQTEPEKDENTKKAEKENDFNFDILRKAKRPYYILILISVIFMAILIMNFATLLTYFVFDGLTPSIIAVIALIPLFLCFKYFEDLIIIQHEIIYKKIMETYSLKKKVQMECDEKLQHKRYIKDMKLLIKEQEIQIDKLSNGKKLLNAPQLLNLLHGFRKGQMEIQIEFAEIGELIDMLPIVVSCISLLPFGMTNYRTKLKRILEDKIEENEYLEMNFYFFLSSYLDCIDVKRLFRKHVMMKKVKKWRLSHIQNTLCDHVIYKEKDPIKLFKCPLDMNAKIGFTVIVSPQHQYRFFDPINGNHCVAQLKVRSIFNSNARPYLIDCYVSRGSDSLLLSSSFILKSGDDLRKDQACLSMFKFMNMIWRENGISYLNKHYVSCLIYRVIPLSSDIGMIEMISDCIELNKIMSLKRTLFTAHCGDDESITNKFHRLIASSAGSFIASFVCGIRDRHDDNILINTKECILFHIDYGYIFNNKVSLDTAKLAITSDLKKIFELYKYGWPHFVQLCVDSWMILRQNANELIDFARIVFAFLYKSNEIELFLRDSLKLDMTPKNARKYISNKIENAPKQWKTKMKNLMHGFAQKISQNKLIDI